MNRIDQVFKGDKKLSEQKIRDINEAFDTLRDTEKRKKYDEQLNNYLNSQKSHKTSSQNKDGQYNWFGVENESQ